MPIACIGLHAAVVAAAHNLVLTALFAAFVSALRQGLIDLVELLGLRTGDPNHGDAEAAGAVLREELAGTLAQLRGA
ncbi:hypothetical protein [Streptomyces sp. NPDC085466]|uniref:hypothetical protein n=1 Tax=Streptomyces sp. NPDC085466 TaxID=3365725 RepID=UPI0037CCF0FD